MGSDTMREISYSRARRNLKAYLLRSPANARHLRESIASVERGEGEVIDIDELAKRLGLE